MTICIVLDSCYDPCVGCLIDCCLEHYYVRLCSDLDWLWDVCFDFDRTYISRGDTSLSMEGLGTKSFEWLLLCWYVILRTIQDSVIWLRIGGLIAAGVTHRTAILELPNPGGSPVPFKAFSAFYVSSFSHSFPSRLVGWLTKDAARKLSQCLALFPVSPNRFPYALNWWARTRDCKLLPGNNVGQRWHHQYQHPAINCKSIHSFSTKRTWHWPTQSIILNAGCLVRALAGTYYANILRRKFTKSLAPPPWPSFSSRLAPLKKKSLRNLH